MKTKRVLIIVIAIIGIILILVGTFGLKLKDEESESRDLEEKFRSAILMIDGISEADVIITTENGKVTGAAAVCKGGGSSAEQRITELLSSGLGLSANKIYVVCNK